MSDDLLKRLENRPNRRSFLKGSALLAASMLVPATLSAQQAERKPEEKKDGQERQEGQEGQEGQAAREGKDKEPAQKAKEGDGAETFVGADGRPYRVCPQCGANMYKQNRTWTCENCGYSYEE